MRNSIRYNGICRLAAVLILLLSGVTEVRVLFPSCSILKKLHPDTYSFLDQHFLLRHQLQRCVNNELLAGLLTKVDSRLQGWSPSREMRSETWILTIV